MEIITGFHEKLKEYTFVFEYVVNIVHISTSLLILVPINCIIFTQKQFQCMPPNKTMERHILDRLENRCYEDYSPLPLPIYWNIQLAMVCITVIIYYICSYWVVEHKEMGPKVRKGIAIGYLIQTLIQICIEVVFIAVMNSMYGFHIPSEYLCQQKDVPNEDIRCEVLLVDAKLAVLCIMFIRFLLVIILHIIDFSRTVAHMCNCVVCNCVSDKLKIDDLLPILKRKEQEVEDDVESNEQQVPLAGPSQSPEATSTAERADPGLNTPADEDSPREQIASAAASVTVSNCKNVQAGNSNQMNINTDQHDNAAGPRKQNTPANVNKEAQPLPPNVTIHDSENVQLGHGNVINIW
ncbi:unnamed protein product [Owenia fusiformis]|uniref:Connexin N-terminal domain-containing protein n=1 Tax=Owenia fusiformis TaxID=6347 RepID=A0A8J1TTA1_OWEFU|nr:unnamed protein product [Owenia fusiformis]